MPWSNPASAIKLSTTEDTKDTEGKTRFSPCPRCRSWWRASFAACSERLRDVGRPRTSRGVPVAQPFRAAWVSERVQSVPARLGVRLDEVGLVVGGLRIAAAFEIEQFDLPEVGWRGLRLDRNVARRQRRAVDLDGRIHRVDGPATDLRLRVLEDGATVDDVPDQFVAVHFRFNAHPLVAVVGLRRG